MFLKRGSQQPPVPGRSSGGGSCYRGLHLLQMTLPHTRSLALALLLVLLLVVGCSSSDESGDAAPSAEMTPISDNLYLSQSNKVVFAQVSAADYSEWKQGFPTSTIVQSVTTELYSVMEDDFDFIIMIVNEAEKDANSAYGVNQTLRNDVTGIGSSTYDYTSSYGASGTLRSILWLAARSYLKSGPSLHEIAHNWANKGIDTYSLSPDANQQNWVEEGYGANGGAHWGFSSVGGQLGGFDEFVSLGNDQYQGKFDGEAGFGPNANGGNGLPYANLELYLMGLIPISEVDNFTVFSGLGTISSGYDAALAELREGKFTASVQTTYTKDNLTSVLGARSPAYPNAQTQFRAITVLLGASLPTDAQLAEVEATLDWFSLDGDDGSPYYYNFYEATQGKASLAMGDLNLHQKSVRTAGGVAGRASSEAEQAAVTHEDADSFWGSLFTLE